MGYWDFQNMGYICKENKKGVEELLTCIGIDFSKRYASEAGEIHSMFFHPDVIMGLDDSWLDSKEIFAIVNRLFEGTFILYEREFGDNTSDSYYRYEEVYDPENKKIYIGEKDYSYGDSEVFGKSVYELLGKEIEEEANKRNIQKDSDDFYDLCDEILESHGGLSEFITTKTRKKTIKTEKIKKENIERIIDTAVKLGYDSLATIISDCSLI